MTDDKRAKANPPAAGGSMPNRLLGSLREALAAASRDATGEITVGERTEILPKEQPPAAKAPGQPPQAAAPPLTPAAQLSAAEAVREAKAPARGHYEAAEPTTRVVRGKGSDPGPAAPNRSATQVVRGKPKVARDNFAAGPRGRLAGGDRRTGPRRVPADLRGQQHDRPRRGPAHPDRLRRQHHLLDRASLHPLRFDGSIVPVRAEPLQDQRGCRSTARGRRAR